MGIIVLGSVKGLCLSLVLDRILLGVAGSSWVHHFVAIFFPLWIRGLDKGFRCCQGFTFLLSILSFLSSLFGA